MLKPFMSNKQIKATESKETETEEHHLKMTEKPHAYTKQAAKVTHQ